MTLRKHKLETIHQKNQWKISLFHLIIGNCSYVFGEIQLIFIKIKYIETHCLGNQFPGRIGITMKYIYRYRNERKGKEQRPTLDRCTLVPYPTYMYVYQ